MSPLAPPLSSLARALLLGAGLLALGGCLDDEAASSSGGCSRKARW